MVLSYHLPLVIHIIFIFISCCFDDKNNGVVIALAISSRSTPATDNGVVDSFSSITPTPTLTNDNDAGGNRCINIEVIPVKDYSDIMKLADLRYDEFVTEESNTGTNFISKRSFRMATAEIYQERTVEGATVFLATMIENAETIAVGAAEASPIEFDQAIKVIEGESSSNSALAPPFLYVTDVVTCSKHRRMGVGNALMEAIEKEAAKRCHYYCNDDNDTNNEGNKISLQNTRLFLNVKNDNPSALKFYKNPKLGYSEYNDSDNYYEANSVIQQQDDREGKIIKVYMNHHQLAKNADTEGQIILSKKIENLSFSGIKVPITTVNDYQPAATDNDNNVVPAWLNRGVEAKATATEDDHHFRQPLQHQDSITDANDDNNSVAVADTTAINELMDDTGARNSGELLQLSEEELVVIMKNILHYPILKQGKVLCHWLKAKEASKTVI